jgi:hypothetical protein
MTRPTVIVQAKLHSRPLQIEWPGLLEPTPWGTSDGSQTPMVRKLRLMSVRAQLALLATCGEWIMARLGETNDPAWESVLALFWEELERPNTVELERLSPEPRDTANAAALDHYAQTVRWTIDVARKLSGAVAGYVESGLRLTEYLMFDKSFTKWRLAAYKRLAAQTGEHTMAAVYARIVARAAQAGQPDYTIKKAILATDGYDPLWGPLVTRDDVFG